MMPFALLWTQIWRFRMQEVQSSTCFSAGSSCYFMKISLYRHWMGILGANTIWGTHTRLVTKIWMMDAGMCSSMLYLIFLWWYIWWYVQNIEQHIQAIVAIALGAGHTATRSWFREVSADRDVGIVPDRLFLLRSPKAIVYISGIRRTMS